jgi:hypothetical protein
MSGKRKSKSTGISAMPKALKAIAPQKQVRVTASDTLAALQKDSNHCAIATAIERTLGATHVSVDRQSIRFTLDGHRYSYMTPPQARDAIMAFDSGQPLPTFRLTLRDGIMAPAGWKASHPTWAGDPALKDEYQRKWSKSRAKRRKSAKARKSRVVLVKTRMDGFKAAAARAI